MTDADWNDQFSRLNNMPLVEHWETDRQNAYFKHLMQEDPESFINPSQNEYLTTQ